MQCMESQFKCSIELSCWPTIGLCTKILNHKRFPLKLITMYHFSCKIRPQNELTLNNNPKVYVNGQIVQYLLAHQINGIQFLYDNYKKVSRKRNWYIKLMLKQFIYLLANIEHLERWKRLWKVFSMRCFFGCHFKKLSCQESSDFVWTETEFRTLEISYRHDAGKRERKNSRQWKQWRLLFIRCHNYCIKWLRVQSFIRIYS